MATGLKDSSPSVFEFTKRKRWADLVITELADSVVLVLSSDCKILYCSTSVVDLLGWRGADLINRDFADLLASEDTDAFKTSFHAGAEFLIYARLRTRDSTFPPHPLYEIKVRPHMSFSIAMARPYPGRNAASLSTFLDLKTENERLQNRLRALTGAAPGATINVSPVISNRYPPSNPGPIPLYTSTSLSIGGYDETTRSPVRSTFEADGGPQNSLYATNTLAEHQDEEDGSKKKKAKKAHNSDQYVCVTCGRTDSPEWRKGPLGPKTLCNACGLRWAKSVRKNDENAQIAGGGEVGELHMA